MFGNIMAGVSLLTKHPFILGLPNRGGMAPESARYAPAEASKIERRLFGLPGLDLCKIRRGTFDF